MQTQFLNKLMIEERVVQGEENEKILIGEEKACL